MTLPTKRVTLPDMLGVGPPESKDWTLSCEKGIILLFQYILRFFFDTALQKSGGPVPPGPPVSMPLITMQKRNKLGTIQPQD